MRAILSKNYRGNFTLLNLILFVSLICTSLGFLKLLFEKHSRQSWANVLANHYYTQKQSLRIAREWQHQRESDRLIPNLDEYFVFEALWTIVEGVSHYERWKYVMENDDQLTLMRDAIRYLGSPSIEELFTLLEEHFSAEEIVPEAFPEIFDKTSDEHVHFKKVISKVYRGL
jgi:hypothetical protein